MTEILRLNKAEVRFRLLWYNLKLYIQYNTFRLCKVKILGIVLKDKKERTIYNLLILLLNKSRKCN